MPALGPASRREALLQGSFWRTLSSEAVVVPGAGVEPARPCGQGIFLPLRLSPPLSGSWSGARLHHGPAALGARRLLSTPSSSRLGSALSRSRDQGFRRI